MNRLRLKIAVGCLLCLQLVGLIFLPSFAPPVKPSLYEGRAQHQAYLLEDGRVFLGGGLSLTPPELTLLEQLRELLSLDKRTSAAVGSVTSWEIFDPRNGHFAEHGDGPASSYVSSIQLPSGLILATGEQRCYCFNPNTLHWLLADKRHTFLLYPALVNLPDGKVLSAGGYDMSHGANFAEIYDVEQDKWFPILPMLQKRYFGTVTRLPNNKILFAGGEDRSAISDCEYFDITSETWLPARGLNTPRYDHTATMLPNGLVLVAGGFEEGNTLNSCEQYDPSTGYWTKGALMNESRYLHTATLLKNGKVLVAGGFNGGEAAKTCELYDPSTDKWTETGSLNTPRSRHTATLLRNGKVLVAGGTRDDNQTLTNCELYDPATGKWTVQ